MTWWGSFNDIIATGAYLEKARYQQEAAMARKGRTAYVQVPYRCSLTLTGKGASGFSHELDAGRQAEFVVASSRVVYEPVRSGVS